MARFMATLLVATTFVGCGAPEDTPSAELSDARVRAMIASATSMDPKAFEDAVLAHGPQDLHEKMPLAMQMLMHQARVRERTRREADLQVTVMTPGELAAALAPTDGGPPALLQSRYVSSVTIEPRGDEAVGRVRFEAPGVFTGQLGYVARRDAQGAWQLAEVSHPTTGVRYERVADGWRVDAETILPLWEANTELPRFSHPGRLPKARDAVFVTIDNQGYLRAGGDPLSLNDLRQKLLDESRSVVAEPDGTCPLPLVMQIDNGTCWRAVQWVMMTAAHPTVKMYKLYFAGLQEDTRRLGGLFLALPKDNGLPPHFPEDFEKLKLKFFAREGAIFGHFTYQQMKRAMYVHMRKRFAQFERGRDATLELVAPPPKGGLVHAGYMLQALDAAMRVGFRDIIFEGAPMPHLRAGRAQTGRDPLTDPEAFRALARAKDKAHVLVKIDDSERLHSTDADGPPLPPGGYDDTPAPTVQRVGDGSRTPVIVTSTSHVLEEELEEVVEEVEPIKESDITADEPVIRDEEVDEDTPGKKEGLSDAPFEGPPSGGRIGPGGGVGRPFGDRGEAKKADPAHTADDAVDDGLRWLAAHQSPETGGWDAAGFRAWCDGKPVEDLARRPYGAGLAQYDAGVSGLALSAFLGAGYTNRGKHPFAKIVSRGLRYLKNIQDPEGCFGPRSAPQYSYNHAMGALAMVEAYGMTGSPIFKGSAQRALDFIAAARNPYFAWRYGIKPGDNDTSITSWMTMCLRSGQLVNADAKRRGKPAPLRLDEAAADGVKAWLEKVTDHDTAAIGYITRGSWSARPKALLDRFPAERSEAMTAAGMYSRLFVVRDPQDALIRKGAARCVRILPTWNTKDGSIDMYYWYYGSLLLFQVGGTQWEAWHRAMEKAALGAQRRDSDYCEYKGSWDPVGVWGPDGGRVYSTAIMTMCLQAPYRYKRVKRPDDEAPKRPK